MARKTNDRPSVYMNATLEHARTRARNAGESLTGEITQAIHRYDALLSAVMPTIEDGQLRALRRILATQPRIPVAFLTPRIMAAMVESTANAEQQSPAALRVTYALARTLAKMDPAACLALVEATERWVRRPGSQQRDSLAGELIAAPE